MMLGINRSGVAELMTAGCLPELCEQRLEALWQFPDCSELVIIRDQVVLWSSKLSIHALCLEVGTCCCSWACLVPIRWVLKWVHLLAVMLCLRHCMLCVHVSTMVIVARLRVWCVV